MAKKERVERRGRPRSLTFDQWRRSIRWPWKAVGFVHLVPYCALLGARWAPVAETARTRIHLCSERLRDIAVEIHDRTCQDCPYRTMCDNPDRVKASRAEVSRLSDWLRKQRDKGRVPLNSEGGDR